MRVIPDPALSEAAWRIVRRRYEGGSYEAEYCAAFERLHRLVPQSVREATAAEEVIAVRAKAQAEALDGAREDYFAGHDKVERAALPHWPRS